MRSVYVVSYDISDPKRLRKVFKTMKSRGDHVQLSVFLCKLSSVELVRLRADLREIVHMREDQVLFFRLGPSDQGVQDRVASLGRPITASLGPEQAMIL